MDEQSILEKIEEVKASGCNVHNDMWATFTNQLNQLTLEQKNTDKELSILRENIKELQTLSLRLQEKNFKIDRVLDSLNDRKIESDALFKKYRSIEEKLAECPLHKQIIDTRFKELESEVKRSKDNCKEFNEDLHTNIEEVIKDKIATVNSGQTLFRWLLSLFLLISLSITGYNIDRTIKLQESTQKLLIRIEKMEQRQNYMNDAVTQNTDNIHTLENNK